MDHHHDLPVSLGVTSPILIPPERGWVGITENLILRTCQLSCSTLFPLSLETERDPTTSPTCQTRVSHLRGGTCCTFSSSPDRQLAVTNQLITLALRHRTQDALMGFLGRFSR